MRVRLLLLPLLLVSCTRQNDTFKPRIVVTSDASIGRNAKKDFELKGYVFDDKGVSEIKVNGQTIQLQAGNNKIAPFVYQAQLKGDKADNVFELSARDISGNESHLKLSVPVDEGRPNIRITRFEKDGNTIRISGVATDNNQVQEIKVDGTRISITPSNRVEFYAETTGVYADIEATDGAGNVTQYRARP